VHAICRDNSSWGYLCFNPPLGSRGGSSYKDSSGKPSLRGSVHGYHLDEVKTAASRNRIVQELLDLESNTTKSIFLFASPQAITNDTNPWRSMLLTLHRKGILRLVVIDELHLYLQFGLSLRSEFKMLTSLLLDKLFPVNNQRSHPALLVMNATISQRWLHTFRKMTKLYCFFQMI
jgi:superfamily II DNA helicase RecQ